MNRPPQITVTLHALSFHALVEITHGAVAPPQLGAPDALLPRLREAFPAGFDTDRAAFERRLAALGPSPPLPPAWVELLRDSADGGSGARVLHVRLGREAVLAREWHARLAPLVLFFVDAGTLLNTCVLLSCEVALCLLTRLAR